MSIFDKVSKEDFAQSIGLIPKEYQSFLSPVSDNVDYYLYLPGAGFGVDKDTKEIVGVHRVHNVLVSCSELLEGAKKFGGTWLSCFDGFLANKYRELGFTVETERLVFNDEYAPSNWDFDRWGRPDVISLSLEKR